MPVFHYLHLRTFAHETEDHEKVRVALRHVASDSKLEPEETAVTGSHGNQIRIFESEVRSASAERALFANLARDDLTGFATLEAQLERRMDENLNFHLRLDKQEAYQGRMVIAHDDDAITLRAKVRSFSKSPDAAALALQDLQALLRKSGTNTGR